MKRHILDELYWDSLAGEDPPRIIAPLTLVKKIVL